ncbi:MAG TPA: alanine dehydrogenase [Nitrospiria bacterium]
MIVAVPKEIKDHEYRVALTPEAAGDVVKSGHRVLVERGAGEGAGFSDEAYRKAGAVLLDDRPRLFGEADLVVKVKEPLPSEYGLFHRGQTLFTFLHRAADRGLTEALLERGVIGIAYETIRRPDGLLPVLQPMSAIAGRMAVLAGAFYLQKVHGGNGTLLPGVPGASPGRVTILGGGTVGTNAAVVAGRMGGQVTLFHRETDRLDSLKGIDETASGRIALRPLTPELIKQSVPSADLLIGAVLVIGDKAPKIVSRAMVGQMSRGSVIVDVSIDQGGCIETSRPTTHSDPIYTVDGVIHYAVTNMPAAFPRTATTALVHVTKPYLMKLIRDGAEGACQKDTALAEGMNVCLGRVVHPGVASAHGMMHEPIEVKG